MSATSPAVPPAPQPATPPSPLNHGWSDLPIPRRQEVLLVLSQIIARASRPRQGRRPALNLPEFSAASPTPTSPACPVDRARPFARLASAKVRDHHLHRKAIVYVRQSSPQQVVEHKESTARQYALVDVAVALGWPRDRVEIIDADQGRSGQTAEGRLGFQYILAEVSLDHVGIVLGLETSRLARSDPDWDQLVAARAACSAPCSATTMVCTTPPTSTTGCCLGLKGIMSEAELHILRVRMHQGRLNKARRGELFNHLPIGYVRVPGGGWPWTPTSRHETWCG